VTKRNLWSALGALVVAVLAVMYFANRPDPAKAVAAAEQLAEEGKRRLASGDAGGALERFESALQVTPGVPNLLFGAGRAAENGGRFAEAEQYFRRAIEGLAPDEDWRFARALGNVLLKTKRAAEAVRPLSRAIALHDQIETHRLYQDALRRAGQHDLVEKLYAERMAERVGDVDALYLYARLVKEPAGRAKVLRTALERAPDHLWSHLALGGTYLEMADGRSALIEFTAAEKLDPPNTKALFGLVRAHLALSDRAATLAAVKQLEERHPGSPPARQARALLDSQQW
jgi:tetratricopeptide (TPR) repeat protein